MNVNQFIWHWPWDKDWSWSWYWSVTGRWYAVWSGFFSALGVPAGIVLYVHHKNCHVTGCRRWLRTHDVFGTPYRACKRHHPGVPDAPITPDHIAAAYAAAQCLSSSTG